MPHADQHVSTEHECIEHECISVEHKDISKYTQTNIEREIY